MGNPLTFFHKEEIEVVRRTVVHKGIHEYCCKKMKKACKDYVTKEKSEYGKKNRIVHSRIYNKETNKIGTETHGSYCSGSSYDSYYDFYNYVEFKYCPFCGTKINGYVVESD